MIKSQGDSQNPLATSSQMVKRPMDSGDLRFWALKIHGLFPFEDFPTKKPLEFPAKISIHLISTVEQLHSSTPVRFDSGCPETPISWEFPARHGGGPSSDDGHGGDFYGFRLIFRWDFIAHIIPILADFPRTKPSIWLAWGSHGDFMGIFYGDVTDFTVRMIQTWAYFFSEFASKIEISIDFMCSTFCKMKTTPYIFHGLYCLILFIPPKNIVILGILGMVFWWFSRMKSPWKPRRRGTGDLRGTGNRGSRWPSRGRSPCCRGALGGWRWVKLWDHLWEINIWLVVWNIFYFPIYWE